MQIRFNTDIYSTAVGRAVLKFWPATVAALLASSLSGCSDNELADPGTELTVVATADREQLTTVLDSVYEADNIVNTLLAVSDGTATGSYGIARGVTDLSSNTAMTADHQFHIASMTKPITVTLLLQLVDDGLLTLDTTLGEVFGDSNLSNVFPEHSFTNTNPQGVLVGDLSINDVQRFGGNSQGSEITILQLTQHTHGMPDYIFDAPTGSPSLVDLTIVGSIGAPIPVDAVAPRQWSGIELFEYYLASGLPDQSLFLPGQGYHYGDSGLLIASLIIERLTGMTLAENYRARIFDPLGMNDTYLMHYEEPRVGA